MSKYRIINHFWSGTAALKITAIIVNEQGYTIERFANKADAQKYISLLEQYDKLKKEFDELDEKYMKLWHKQ